MLFDTEVPARVEKEQNSLDNQQKKNVLWWATMKNVSNGKGWKVLEGCLFSRTHCVIIEIKTSEAASLSPLPRIISTLFFCVC